jgi:hypothetical protein
MANRPKISISERLNFARMVIMNTISNVEIQKLVGEYGYNSNKMKEGKKLYDTAMESVNKQIASVGAQYQATEKLEIAEKEAKEAYQKLAKVSRAVFSKAASRLAMLGLKGLMPQATAAFLSSAFTMFDNALNVNEIKSALSAYGYSKEKLEKERLKIVGYDNANQVQESAKGSAQQATHEQDKAVSALSDWVSQYTKIAKVALKGREQLLEKLGITARTSKTKAQRSAPKKASATRTAKKLKQ